MKNITLLFLVLICQSVHALKITLPTAEAVVHLIKSKDIPHTTNYSYDLDFVIPYNKVNIYIQLREGGIEDIQERKNLTNNILVYIRHIKEKYKLTSLSAQVYYETQK